MTSAEDLCEQAVGIYEKDPWKAFDLFSQAAAQGSGNAMFGMAEMKMQGIGTPRDPEGAKKLY